MTAHLSGIAGPEFENAAAFDQLFDHADHKKLERYLIREFPPLCSPQAFCNTNLFFGFFFDGTGNNYVSAEKVKSHSNIARLYDCFPGLSVPGVLPKSTDWEYKPNEYKHFFRVYIPGVGTKFPEVKDSGAGIDKLIGGASGSWGERRIIWALVQAINNVHRFFLGSALISPSETEKLFGTLTLTKSTRWLVEGRNGADTDILDSAAGTLTEYILSGMLTRLHQAVAQHWLDKRTGKPSKKDPGIVKTIYISIFGFSRGATLARAFANWLHTLCRLDAQLCGAKQMSLGGVTARVSRDGAFIPTATTCCRGFPSS